MNAIQTKHEESGCPDYLQHNAENCPCLIAEQYSDDQYDTEAIEIDARHGNFNEDRAEDYRHENIVRASLVNGQFSQARKQCESYGLIYEAVKFNIDNERRNQMRQIDNMTPQELDTLALKGMTPPRTASERLAQARAALPDLNEVERRLPAPNKAQHSQWFGVYDPQGTLRATFDSEPEAYFYIRNRGHVNGGTYKAIEASK